MKAKRQYLRLDQPKKFFDIAQYFAYKNGLCIFELDSEWRILSWWNEQHTCTNIHTIPLTSQEHNIRLPFIGGWVGWMKYPVPQIDHFFWKTDGAICLHIPSRVYHIIGTPEFCREAQKALLSPVIPRYHRKKVKIPTPNRENEALFCDSVDTLRQAIRDGMVYQTNLAWRSQPFRITTPLAHYLHLQHHNPARFGCYLQFNDTQVISNSPELFLRSWGSPKIIHSQPIKGTALRGNYSALWNDPKERAELTMIADLVRNDLGKIAAAGSVHTHHRKLRRCGDLLHAEQSIYAQMDTNKNIFDVLKATFPAGSITGAPKKSAIQYIDRLEPFTRGLYTGAVGFFSDHDIQHFNVAIRTLFVEQEETHLYVGCGIVHDSNPQKEWEESLAKGNALSKILFT